MSHTLSKLKKHRVLVREVHVRTVEVMTETEEEALTQVAHGEGENINFEYGHTMSRDTWTVEEVKCQPGPDS